MLKCFSENIPQANFFIIKDTQDVSGQDLFVAFLMQCEGDSSVKEINLICYENPPAFYMPSNKFTSKKITSYNFFSDPCGWNDPSAPKTDLNLFTSDSKSFKETAFFIDSLSLLAQYHGFCSVYRNLFVLKKHSKKIVCIVHQDLFSPDQLEELSFLATFSIELEEFSMKTNSEEKIVKFTYKKTGGKILNQEEIISIDNNFQISSRIKESKNLVLSNVKEDVENLTTFKLGLHMSEGERKARDELILPYLKTKAPSQSGQILYQAELEDDPDDDLDI